MKIDNNINESNIERVLEFDLNKETPDRFFELPSIARIITAFIISALCLAIVRINFSLYVEGIEKYPNEEWKYHIATLLIFLSLFTSGWFFSDAIFGIISIFLGKDYEHKSFNSFALHYNERLIKFISALLIYIIAATFLLRIQRNNINTTQTTTLSNQDAEDTETLAFSGTPFEFRFEFIHRLLIASTILLFFHLLVRIIIQYLNYKIHYTYYKKRIEENDRNVKYLQGLNRITGKRANKTLEEWAEMVYETLSGQKEALVIEDFKYFFGVTEGEKMFDMFDVNHDEYVSKEEFIKNYVKIFNEKTILRRSLSEKDSCMHKLSIVLEIIFMLIGSFFAFVILGHNETYKSLLGSFAGVVLPLSFVFGSVLSDVFQSILFIFSVRPFDIGDMITINGKTYVVVEMGLLYSTLTSDSKYYNFPNDILRKNPVTNLRRSDYVVERFNQSYEISSAKDKINLLQKKIDDYLEKYPKLFKPVCEINQFEVVGGNTLKLNISIILNCKYQDVKGVNVRRDMFVLFLDEVIKELGIINK
ncbi:Mechanosensitive ion channel protein 10 [Astathelohania contejeani]|uniref:Mechanosensitive ion channel protein 10 n=1 Tax=Astathelohania contejeani TaxID=164912 RepID=A0ABQ7HWR7_9MICR|nr:Mechanosensitive ion channel protein 10 [Thelohania contejeani]